MNYYDSSKNDKQDFHKIFWLPSKDFYAKGNCSWKSFLPFLLVISILNTYAFQVKKTLFKESIYKAQKT